MLRLNVIALAAIVFLQGCESEQSPSQFVSECPDANPSLNLYWGDLHVHSAYSMDAFAFGTKARPDEAFRFAKGEVAQTLPDGTQVKISRPLDFAAVTDHAETFDVMHLCTESDHGASYEYCQQLLALGGSDLKKSLTAFREFLLPVIAGDTPKPPALCSESGIDCQQAALEQWHNVQRHAHEANQACTFSAFVGFEWSATPNSAHWHRNVIFKDENVSREAIDYVRHSSPDALWTALEKQCKIGDGCEAIAIPHNTNLSEGGGFDVENRDQAMLFRRAKYERLIELFQSKGNSECLAENWDDPNSDCGFEAYLLGQTQKKLEDDPKSLGAFNRSFTRNILSRGLQSYAQSGDTKLNPLQLGIIGSTDNHTATPGLVDEQDWKGDAWGAGDVNKNRRLQRMEYNPGGLVAVWAEENTRARIFDALKNRHVYGTSGTRIRLKFSGQNDGQRNELCQGVRGSAVPMGGSLRSSDHTPEFAIEVARDVAPIARIEIVKGRVSAGQINESVTTIFDAPEGVDQQCVTWVDPDFDPKAPSYWYVRTLEVATPRWSKYVCEDLNVCTEKPEANRLIQERAWSSPIWYLP